MKVFIIICIILVVSKQAESGFSHKARRTQSMPPQTMSERVYKSKMNLNERSESPTSSISSTSSALKVVELDPLVGTSEAKKVFNNKNLLFC